jgi:hypothetical protein
MCVVNHQKVTIAGLSHCTRPLPILRPLRTRRLSSSAFEVEKQGRGKHLSHHRAESVNISHPSFAPTLRKQRAERLTSVDKGAADKS